MIEFRVGDVRKLLAELPAGSVDRVRLTTAESRRMSETERFWCRVRRTEGCWLWLGGRNSKGYGIFRYQGKPDGAHRVAYRMLVGPIPAGAVIDHLCRNPRCVNPEHLEPVSNSVNLLRGSTKRIHNSSKTHCPQGHPYSGDNLYLSSRGRQCRECRRRQSQERHKVS